MLHQVVDTFLRSTDHHLEIFFTDAMDGIKRIENFGSVADRYQDALHRRFLSTGSLRYR